jgi:hypothetical protein
MADPQPVQASIGPLREAFADLRNTAREQMVAAWQIHIEQLQQQLAAEWPERIAWIFEERFRELQSLLEEQYRASVNEQVSAALLDARATVRRDFAEKLNQSMRRLRMFESDAQWASAVLDATEPFCDRAALFTLAGMNLRMEGVRGMQRPTEMSDVPLTEAPAFASVVATSDAMVALRTQGELSVGLAGLFGEDPDLRSYLFPIATRERVLAILYADSAGVIEASALELLAGIAGTVLDSLSGRSSSSPQLVRISAGDRTGAGIGAWFELSRQDQELHLKAQRFARVQVAEMRLYKSDAVKEGRARRDLYATLQTEIDNARERFQRDYLTATPTMVDYFHLELVRTLANDEAELLGRSYPGPLA